MGRGRGVGGKGTKNMITFQILENWIRSLVFERFLKVSLLRGRCGVDGGAAGVELVEKMPKA